MLKTILILCLFTLACFGQSAVLFTGQPGAVPVSVVSTYTSVTGFPTASIAGRTTAGTGALEALDAAAVNTLLGTITAPTPCATSGGVYYQNGTPAQATCSGNLTWDGANFRASDGSTATARILISGGSVSYIGRNTADTNYVPVAITGSSLTFTPASGGATLARTSLAATPATSWTLSNSTTSTSGVPVQMAPCSSFLGHAWNTGGTPADNTDQWRICAIPTSGNPPTSTLSWALSQNGGAYGNAMTLTSGGALAVPGSLNAGTQISLGAASPIAWSGRGKIYANSVDGVFLFANSTTTIGASLDFTTAGTLRVRNQTNTADGTIIAKLPTSCTGLDSGVLYNNAGTPAFCP